MSTRTLIAVIWVSMFTSITIISINDDGGHKKRMNLIEEQERLLNLKDKVKYQRTIKFIDSMDVEINKKFNELNNK